MNKRESLGFKSETPGSGEVSKAGGIVVSSLTKLL